MTQGVNRNDGSNGQAASVASVPGTGKWQFWKQVPVQEGANTLSITATNANGGAASTKNYSITVSGVTTQYAYDGNGNTTDVKDATGAVLRHYEWDTLSRLLAIQEGATPAQGAHRTEFSYDGAGRRVRQIEKTGNGTAWVQASNNTFLWVGMELCGQRDATGGIVQRNYYGEGEERLETGTSQKYYYTHDHLGSVREVTDSTGTLVARYDYDVWGKRTQLSGTFVCERGFTGHWHHAWSNLIVAPFRVYDSDVGRWLSEDPIGEEGGLNLYGYVENGPMGAVDLLGLIDIFIGGGLDHTQNHNVESFYDRYHETYPNSAYFTFDQKAAILELIKKQKKGEPINLIGHSYGGDTAAKVAQDSSRAICNLVTIDPVSRHPPDFKKVKQNVKNWVNVMAKTKGTSSGDILAGLGGAWNESVKGSADTFKTSDSHHEEFSKMMGEVGFRGN